MLPGARKRPGTGKKQPSMARSSRELFLAGWKQARSGNPGPAPPTLDRVAGFLVQPRRTNCFVGGVDLAFQRARTFKRRSCDPDRGRASSPAILRKRLAPSRVSGGVDGRFICRSGFWSQQARFTFLSLPNRFLPCPPATPDRALTGRMESERWYRREPAQGRAKLIASLPTHCPWKRRRSRGGRRRARD